jgi:hypothetical protein
MSSTQPKPFVFVLMPFDSSFDDIYKFGIKGAADEVGAYAERVDEQMYSGGILDRIFNQISKADAIVADMTGRNPNVFYEVGYAHALGKVVLLLTKNASDIPFDLKHRPHTVYEGKIEALRTALVTRLQWAIAESRKQQQAGGTERLSIRVYGIDVEPSDASVPFDREKIPVVNAVSRARYFSLPIHLRNDSLEGMVGITHVYLFCAGGATLVPFEYRTVNSVFYGTTMFTHGIGPGASTYEEPTELDSFSASQVDAPDGLLEQFRIKANFPAVPPGAVEEAALKLIFRAGQGSCDAIYRLRLHSARQFHDFRFRMAIEYKPEPKTKVESAGTEAAPKAES